MNDFDEDPWEYYGYPFEHERRALAEALFGWMKGFE